MVNVILSPPIAFLIYLALAGILNATGRSLAGPSTVTPLKRSTYSSGEMPPDQMAAPGYRPFLVIALFFAILHLGVLVLGLGGSSTAARIYLGGLMLALLALILG